MVCDVTSCHCRTRFRPHLLCPNLRSEMPLCFGHIMHIFLYAILAVPRIGKASMVLLLSIYFYYPRPRGRRVQYLVGLCVCVCVCVCVCMSVCYHKIAV